MFQGYTQETVDFMWGIRFNNERGWFLEHKQQYQTQLLEPTRALGEQVYEGVQAMLPQEPLMLKTSRIYRDARRLFGRGPYKDHLWFCVRTGDKDWTGRPTFYFEIAPEYYSYGMGFWQAPAELMEAFRRDLQAHPAKFEKLVRGFEKQDVFTLNGDSYARSRGGDQRSSAAMVSEEIHHSQSRAAFGRENFSSGAGGGNFGEFQDAGALLQVFCRAVRLGSPWEAEGRNIIFV